MTQETAASARFEERWQAATKTSYDPPTIEGEIDDGFETPEFGEMVRIIAARVLEENLIGKADHDKMVACARDIDAVLAAIPTDKLEAVLNRAAQTEGGS